MPWIGEKPPGEIPELPPEPEKIELKPEVSKDLVESYELFKDEIKPEAKIVYYPSCAMDVSLSAAFDKSQVLYVDIDERAVAALKKAGYEAYNESALEFKPERPVDILILLNPELPPDVPSQHVKGGGFVVCNDYHRTATLMRDDKKFQLLGVIRRDQQTGKKLLDTESLEDFWKTVETDEELKKAPFSWGAVSYKEAAVRVKKTTGKDTDIVNEYKKILEQVRQKEAKGEMFSEIVSELPRKKGVVDDLFIYKRLKEESEVQSQ